MAEIARPATSGLLFGVERGYDAQLRTRRGRCFATPWTFSGTLNSGRCLVIPDGRHIPYAAGRLLRGREFDGSVAADRSRLREEARDLAP